MKKEIYEFIKKEIKLQLNDDFLDLDNLTSLNDLDDWDSLYHVSLLTALEIEYDIEISIVEAEDIFEIDNLIDIVIAKINNK